MNNSLIIGGSNGIGLAIALELAKTCKKVSIIDKVAPDMELPNNTVFEQVNLLNNDFSFLDEKNSENLARFFKFCA